MLGRFFKIGYYLASALISYLLLVCTRKKIKNCLLYAHFESSGGTRTYFFYLVEYLSKSGIDITVLLSRAQIDDDILELQARFPFVIQDLNFELQSTRFDGTVFYKKNQQNFVYHLKELVYFFDELRGYRCGTLVISEGTPAQSLFLLLAPVRLIYILHTVATNPLDKLKKSILNRSITARKQLVTVSEYSKKLLLQNWVEKKYGDYVRVVYNYYEPETRNSSFADKQGKNVLTIGTVAFYKNPLFWIAVAKEVSSQYKVGVTFTWAGDGELMKECITSSLGFENIKFIGERKDVDALYKSCDLYFQPSVLESNGMAVIGAMYHEKACVVSDRQGLPESVTDQLTGFVVPVENTKACVEAILELLNNSEKATAFGKAGKVQFESYFTKNKWVKEMDKVFM